MKYTFLLIVLSFYCTKSSCYITENREIVLNSILGDRQYCYSKDFLSAGFFFHLSDHAYMPTTTNFDPFSIRQGDIIFVPEYALFSFHQNVQEKIQNKYILLIHISGMSYNYDILYKILKNSNIMAIFTIDAMIQHPKIIPIPLGIWPHVPIANHMVIRPPNAAGRTRDFPTWNKYIHEFTQVKNEKHQKKYLCYLNYQVRSGERKVWFDFLKDRSFCFFRKERLSSIDFFRDIAQSHFVLSPPGFAYDCFRTWEVLYLGSIPIILSSNNDELYRDLPVLIIHDIEEITEGFLQNTLHEFSKRTFNFEKLQQNYWRDLIFSYKQKIISMKP